MSKTLDEFQKELWAWKEKQFPDATIDSVIKHLQEEMHEFSSDYFWAASWDATDEEAADVLIMLCQYANFRGKSLMELAESKMRINYAREWGEPDKDGVRRHIG